MPLELAASVVHEFEFYTLQYICDLHVINQLNLQRHILKYYVPTEKLLEMTLIYLLQSCTL